MSKFNKVITNVPVPLDETEVENLSQTLSGLLNGGGGEGKIYEGDGVYIDVDNTHITGKITLTQTAKTKLDTPIPTQVADLTDSANYETTEHANATYLTKASADTLYAPLSVTGDIEYLSGEFNNYYKKTETSSKEQLSDEFEQLKTDMEDYVTENTFYGAVEELENEKQNKLTFGYNSESAISSINGSALAGQETTTYDYGTDLIIDEYHTIQVNTNGTANNFGKSFVEGQDTKAAGAASHAEGKLTSAMSDYSHTEGYKNIDYEITNQIGSNHTEGAYNNVSGVYTHVEGHANGASGYGLHVQGGYNLFAIHNISANKSDPDGRWNVWGISVEGMANATTAEPISGYDGEGHPLYVHGGILKVIGNGTRTKTDESDPSTEIINRSDALIIYRDGCISAAGNISANGVELGAGGGGTSYQGRNGVDVNGGYVELTTTAYNAVTSVSNISNDVNTLKGASGDWNKVSDKLDTTAFSTVSSTFLTEHQSLDEYATKEYANNASANALSEAETWVEQQGFYTKASGDNDYAPKSVTATINTLTGASAGWNEVTSKLGTAQYAIDSATFVTSSNSTITGTKQYALTTAGWAEVQTGDTLTANSGINIDNNLINVTLGRNLKFDPYSRVTTEDNISATNFRAGEYDGQYTIVNMEGLESHFKSLPDSDDVMTLTPFGLHNISSGANRCISANYDLNHLFFKSYDNIGTYSGDYSQVEVKVFQEREPAETQHRSSITLTDYYGGVEHTGLITVEKIAQWDQGGGFTGVTTAGSISGDGLTNPLGLKTSAENALTSVSNKVDKPTSLVNKYLVLRTDNAGEVSGWYDLTDEYYNKRQINDTFVATAFIDTTTLSGFGKSSNKKLGVNTDVIATKDYVNDNFLPTSGGTVSGQLVVSGGSNYDQENLKFIRTGQNGYGRIGLASNGALAVKVDDNNSNITQINVAANASYNELIQVQHAGTTAYLIPAVTANTTAGLTNDGILHIILES